MEIKCCLAGDDSVGEEEISPDTVYLENIFEPSKVLGFDFIYEDATDPRTLFYEQVEVTLSASDERDSKFDYREFSDDYDVDCLDCGQVFYDYIRSVNSLGDNIHLDELNGTLEDHAKNLFEECYSIPEGVSNYIDWDSVAKDFSPEHAEFEGSVYLYDER